MMNDLQKIAGVLKSNKKFAIYSHAKTDYDAICSSLALKRILISMGKIAHVFIDSDFPKNAYGFEDTAKINAEKESLYDVAVVVDCSNPERLGRNMYKFNKKVKTTINIDHHLGNTRFGKYNYIKEGESSTCELIFNLIEELNVPMDKETARLLISGIYTDSGSLQYSSTHPSTFKTCAKLLKISGLRMDEISSPIFNSQTIEGFKLRKVAFNKLELYEDNAVAIISLTAKDFEETKAVFLETTGMVGIAMQIESVKVMALISEDPEDIGTQYVSIRSKGGRSARNVAIEFGGGGHEQAAGCKIIDTPENAKQRVLEALIKEYRSV